jgi:hypothetical protein
MTITATIPDQLNYFFLPQYKRDQLEAQAARQGCTPNDLIDRVWTRAKKDSRFVELAKATADEIDSALERGEPTGRLWPRSLYRCLLAAMIRDARFEQAAEEQLLEMSAEQLGQVECICRRRGWSYEDYVYEALCALHNRRPASPASDDDDDPADWWKKA